MPNIEYAARLGLSGVLYPWAAERPPEEVREVRQALSSNDLACSCIVAVPLQSTFGGPWTSGTADGKAALGRHVAKAANVAASLGSTVLAALITADPERDSESQLDDTASNLNAMASIAADHGMTLAIEPMVALPGMLTTTTGDTVRLIERADHPALGLIFDTAHVAAMDGDILRAYAACAEHVALLQLVDAPGRIEPGAGTLPLVELAANAIARGYTGLVDFEHEWLAPDETGGGSWAGPPARIRRESPAHRIEAPHRESQHYLTINTVRIKADRDRCLDPGTRGVSAEKIGALIASPPLEGSTLSVKLRTCST
ncbi:sugar phosphate isomerase/epimerase family protein [Pseudarthrobacter sp. SLBN-100]